MSLTSTVPSEVPSLFQSSTPVAGSKAPKKSVPFTMVGSFQFESSGPGLMSLTSTVPSGVPSVFQGSHPVAGSQPTKKSAPANTGPGPKAFGTISVNITVPASVPSVFHTSPAAASAALKKTAP